MKVENFLRIPSKIITHLDLFCIKLLEVKRCRSLIKNICSILFGFKLILLDLNYSFEKLPEF